MKTIKQLTTDFTTEVKDDYKIVKDKLTSGAKSVREAGHKTEKMISQHPKSAVAIAAGVGAAIGATTAVLWNRSRTKKAARTTKAANSARGGRMTAAKNRAAHRAGGKGPVKNRPAGKKAQQ